MDGDFTPVIELVELRKKHGFLLVIDDFLPALGTLICGKHGGGVAKQFDCENDVDICIRTLSELQVATMVSLDADFMHANCLMKWLKVFCLGNEDE
ncbi:8-amino-7-oxononanoate synthase-like isoform X5 [Magnolia sinica]|uniref:8-amino-7-oxononanoate synthase-like isoform X5 n=1 Tax=Magnolia sinica TaxID=86752 RepID=UPI0026590791|nr:8-amino-7-oxononanoate synthase-like isoform X5 [Magnolia sinica]